MVTSISQHLILEHALPQPGHIENIKLNYWKEIVNSTYAMEKYIDATKCKTGKKIHEASFKPYKYEI